MEDEVLVKTTSEVLGMLEEDEEEDEEEIEVPIP